ncbi:glutamate receptor U1-like [Linepithema humile]|uniref:glutamate receptor U1-like n=1 Tax=Linepithema humile TaxID=83485 RepID=UPI0006234DD5|nr:PREDICTED: glutamate receptor 1-like [Linepithema humile]
MRLPLCMMYSMLFCILLSSAERHFNISVFVDVILSIRRFYSAATVMFAHPGDDYKDYGDLEITHLVHACSRRLSQHYVVTVNMFFKKMERSLRYHNQIVQPITIVIMPNVEAYQEFAEVTKTYPMSFPVWFVLFLYPIANDTHNYCLEPIGNPFNIAFDTQMLVLCHDEDILREWYSVKGETVKTSEIAVWEDDKGFVSLTNVSLYDRRKDLEGVVLRAVVVKDVPISLPNIENYVANLYGKVLQELQYSLNFTLKIVSELDDHGTYDFENNIWSGVMGEIVSGRADFAIADMSMTSLRIKDVDFTLPLIVSKNSLFIKEPAICGVKWLGYFQAFNSQIWIALVMIIAITPLLLSYMKSYMKTVRGIRQIVDLISDNFLCIWGIFCQQALIEFPTSSPLRLAYFTIFLTAVLIMAHYSAALVCFLTACTRVLPFRTIDEFVNDGTYELILPRGSADYDVIAASEETFSMRLMKLMKDESELPVTLIDGFVQVCNEKNVAYMTLNALKKSVEMRIPCKLSAVGTEKIDNLGIVLSKGNPYTAVINYHLQKFLDNGMMMRLKDTSFLMESFESKAYEPVHVAGVVPILAILCGGFVLCIIVLFTEKIYYRYTKKKFESKVFYYSKKQLFIKKR